MIFNKLIQKIEQDKQNYLKIKKQMYDGEISEKDYNWLKTFNWKRCEIQLSLLKTLQKEVEEVLDKMLEDYNERLVMNQMPELTQANVSGIIMGITLLKSSLENVGVKDGYDY